MPCGWNGPGTQRRRYHSSCPGGSCICLIGAVLAAVGLVVLFLCVPDWAWLALLGVILVALGYLLLKRSISGR